MEWLNVIYALLVGGLGLLSLFILPSTRYLRKIHKADASDPKNVLLRVLSQNALVINTGAFLVSAIVAHRYFEWFQGNPFQADPVGFILMLILTAILTVPYRTAKAMKAIGGESENITKPLTRDQREDLAHGELRREQEAEHLREYLTNRD